jgi:enoyl-CoA hydratase/carnithine racemase
MDPGAAEAIASTLREVSDDYSIGAVVLQIPREFPGVTADAPTFAGLLAELANCRKPVVATIEHDICAEALMMVALSDVAIMLNHARLVGGLELADTPLNAVVLHRLRLAMGHPKTFELAALPRYWSAEECLRAGVISRLAADAETCTDLGLRFAEEVSHLTRPQAWRIDRNYLGRDDSRIDPDPQLRVH